MANQLRVVLSDQLSETLSALHDLTLQDTVLLCEVREEATYVKHHPKKIAFWFATMRHFSQSLEQKGIRVRYVTLTDPDNTNTLKGEIIRAVHDLQIQRVIVTEPSEYRLKQLMKEAHAWLNVPLNMRPDQRFVCSLETFAALSQNKKQWRMEYFYREMRKKYRILIEPDGKPTGGQWNYDKDNRKSPTENLVSPPRISHKKSSLLKEVLTLVAEEFSDHFGDLEPFHYAVTREQALIELNHFIEYLLPQFGDYQDAMVKGEAYLYHSLLSSYLNAGLLLPLEVCQHAEHAYRQGRAPLAATEGFIRQVLGWREYVRGIYWMNMPAYAELNYLNAHHPLPDFYWGNHTHMTCVSESVAHTQQHAYSHHIQRLMVTGNFALLAGLDVKQVQEWYLAVYSDAYEWVEMPNTLGMALFGDGGILGSKPYAASGKYIDKMSNFCKHCRYDPQDTLGEKACPFNALYWDFMARHQNLLKDNHRLFYVYATWNKFSKEKQEAIREKASQLFKTMNQGEL